MLKITHFEIGKNKKYFGWAIKILCFKFEIMKFKNNWTFRFEISKGWN